MIAWLKKWWGLIPSAFALLFGMGWIWNRRRRLGSEARALIASVTKSMIEDKAIRVALLGRSDEHTAEIEKINERIEQGERVILAQHHEIEGLTREQIREKLRRLGY